MVDVPCSGKNSGLSGLDILEPVHSKFRYLKILNCSWFLRSKSQGNVDTCRLPRVDPFFDVHQNLLLS